MQPDIMILDEPTSALDKPTQNRILDLLFNLQQTRKISYLLISHDHRVINSLCHRVMKFSNGQLTEAPEEIAA